MVRPDADLPAPPSPGDPRPYRAFGALPSDRRFPLLRAKYALLADEVADLALALGRPPRVLDAGLGQAKLQRVLLARHPGVSVGWVGLDLLAFRLRLRLDVPGVARVQGDIHALPLADGALDAAVCCWVLQHAADPTRAVRELARVVRPGGRVLLAVPCGPPPLRWARERVHPAWVWFQRRALGRSFSYLPQHQFFDAARARRLVEDAGLVVARAQGFGFVTGGPLRPLEDLAWYYRLNVWAGAKAPGWTQSLVVVADRPR